MINGRERQERVNVRRPKPGPCRDGEGEDAVKTGNSVWGTTSEDGIVKESAKEK